MEEIGEAASGEITVLLRRSSEGDRTAEEELYESVYAELKRMARGTLQHERHNHSLSPTALVNEAFLRLPREDFNWRNRGHFYSVAALAMRRVLVDHAREVFATKRPNPVCRVEFEDGFFFTDGSPEDMLAVDAALGRLAVLDTRQAQVVELRYFGGMSEEEIGILLKCSVRTVRRDWQVARLWFHAQLKSADRPNALAASTGR